MVIFLAAPHDAGGRKMRAEFDETLVTGNEMIDSQHKELIGKINKLLDSCEVGNDKRAAVKTLD